MGKIRDLVGGTGSATWQAMLPPRCTWDFIERDGVEFALVIRDGRPLRAATGLAVDGSPDLTVAMLETAEQLLAEHHAALKTLGITAKQYEAQTTALGLVRGFADEPCVNPNAPADCICACHKCQADALLDLYGLLGQPKAV